MLQVKGLIAVLQINQCALKKGYTMINKMLYDIIEKTKIYYTSQDSILSYSWLSLEVSSSSSSSADD